PLDLIARQFKADALDAFCVGWKPQCIPRDRDLTAPDTKKTAEVDDRRPDLSASIHNDVDDTPHILIGPASDLSAQTTLNLLMIENRHGRLSQVRTFDRVFLRWSASLMQQRIPLSG